MAVAIESPFVASRVPGRLRLRRETIRLPAINAALAREIASWEGVTRVEGKPATGSLLIHYDVERIGQEFLESRAIDLMATINGARVVSRRADSLLWALNRPAKIGMFGCAAGMLAALAFSARVHAVFGVAYLGLLAVHLANHRGRMVK